MSNLHIHQETEVFSPLDTDELIIDRPGSPLTTWKITRKNLLKNSGAGFYASKSGAITVPADDGLAFVPNTVVYDDFSAVAASVFTPPAAGLYGFEFNGAYSITAGGYLSVGITPIVGTALANALLPTIADAGSNLTVAFHTILRLAQNQAVELLLNRGEGFGDLTIVAGAWLKIHKLA